MIFQQLILKKEIILTIEFAGILKSSKKKEQAKKIYGIYSFA